MKLLLYCTKQSHELYATDKGYVITDFKLGDYYKTKEKLNGKIIAECDFEVEEITHNVFTSQNNEDMDYYYLKSEHNLVNESCLRGCEIDNYLKQNNGYAIHIKNLHIFDEPRELSEYANLQLNPLIKAPQNMCYVYECDGVLLNFLDYTFNEKELTRNILISIQPQWMYKILNGEKTIEVRKKVLSEMK